MLVLKQLNLRFVIVMLAYGGIVFLVYRDEVIGSFLAPLAEGTARITSELLRQLGIQTLRNGAVLTHPNGFAYEVAYTCTGLLPGLTFIVCVLAYPGTLRDKWPGIAVGVPALLAVNYIRLVNLFYIGVLFPSMFGLAHEVIWEGLLAVSFISLWLSWICWSNNRQNGKLNYRSANPVNKRNVDEIT